MKTRKKETFLILYYHGSVITADCILFLDSDLNLHSCTKKLKNKINSTEKRKRKHLEKRSRGSSKSRNTWKTDLDRVLTCIECSWYALFAIFYKIFKL